jgi:hypothetical protein
MNNPKIIRWTGIAVIVAAITVLSAEFIQDTPLSIYGVILIGSLIGFIGIHQYQKDTAGVLSIISVIALLLAFFFYGSGNDNLGDIAFPIAFLLLGIACYQSGKFPRWASSALILGVVISLIGDFLPSLPRTIDAIDALIFAAGFGTIGYTVWKGAAQSELSEKRSSPVESA